MAEPSKYKPEFCYELIKHMKSGQSFGTFGTVAQCSRKTLYTWIDKYPDFANAKELAEAESQSYWEKLSIALASGNVEWFKKQNLSLKDANPTMVIFTLKTRFHDTYKEVSRTEHTGADGTALTLIVKDYCTDVGQKLEKVQSKRSGKRANGNEGAV